MTWFIGQSIFIIAAAFLLGILVGWLVWGRILRPERATSGTDGQSTEAAPVALALEAAETEPELAAKTETAPASEADEEPEPVAAEPPSTSDPVPAVDAGEEASEEAAPVVIAQAAAPEIEQPADELERIEGIGPKMAGALIKSGIRTYAQLAAADQESLRNAIEAEGLRFAPSIVTWSRQAQLLADGDEAGFEDLTRRLVAGRDEGRE